ncbi:zinc-dependent alcohol dehydrogenase family protein [Dyadobacter sp. CY261]|uniref:zinc-dependent alcohol dehydrogenase family protein n=1 Tax=Dyadobacter sp. CY261 TaxID=2907203 RepID=UPI001F2418D5|nr:zinc-dependent alcohol dehydrogenase family protein [Dyadobacter sp. CY261]MCF0074233.1 zinc-dependent alcohol dehydrogenase family protein [Dyadobacter sp. CY261]
MKALVLEAFNTPYQIKDVVTPVAREGEVLVKISHSGVNPLDLKIVAGEALHAQVKLPAILGIDMAGTVEAVGDGVTRFKPGDEVYGMIGGVAGVQGSLAEYASVDADLLAIKPGNLTMKENASIPLAFITAWEGLVDRAKIGHGKTVLIHGGAGGVGQLAIQIAAAMGAQVFATVNHRHMELIHGYGATPVDHHALSVEAYVKEYTNDDGFDIIFDTLGGATLDASFKAAKQYDGHVVSILGWGSHSLAPLSFRGATYSGVFTLYPLISGKARAHHGRILSEATRLIEAGKVSARIEQKDYTMDSVLTAYADLQRRHAAGKVIIRIAGS